jgi:uncharacterized protein YbaA (DUF1428 family)
MLPVANPMVKSGGVRWATTAHMSISMPLVRLYRWGPATPATEGDHRSRAAPMVEINTLHEVLTMSRYVDGFVLPVPTNNIEAYRKMAELAGQVWREHGALEFVECIAEDVKSGEVTSFPQSVKLEADETVVFAWIVYPSREDRDRILDAVLKDPRLAHDPKDMPFDGKRMFWGGFEVLVRA